MCQLDVRGLAEGKGHESDVRVIISRRVTLKMIRLAGNGVLQAAAALPAAHNRPRIYDAFVSYSHRDEDFVLNHLVPRLEQQGRNVCPLNWLNLVVVSVPIETRL